MSQMIKKPYTEAGYEPRTITPETIQSLREQSLEIRGVTISPAELHPDDPEKANLPPEKVAVAFRSLILNGENLTQERKEKIRQDILANGVPLALYSPGFGQFAQMAPEEQAFYDSAYDHAKGKWGLALETCLPDVPPRSLGNTYDADASVIERALHEKIKETLKAELDFSDEELEKVCLCGSTYIEAYSEGSAIGLALSQHIDTMQKQYFAATATDELQSSDNLPENLTCGQVADVIRDHLPHNTLVMETPGNLFNLKEGLTDDQQRFYILKQFTEEVLHIAGTEAAARVSDVDGLPFNPMVDRETVMHNLYRLIIGLGDDRLADAVRAQFQQTGEGSVGMLSGVIGRAWRGRENLANQASKWVHQNTDACNQLGENWNVLLPLGTHDLTVPLYDKISSPAGAEDQSNDTASESASKLQPPFVQRVIAKVIHSKTGMTPEDSRAFASAITDVWDTAVRFMKQPADSHSEVPESAMLSDMRETPVAPQNKSTLSTILLGINGVVTAAKEFQRATPKTRGAGNGSQTEAPQSQRHPLAQRILNNARRKVAAQIRVPEPGKEAALIAPEPDQDLDQLATRLFPNAGRVGIVMMGDHGELVATHVAPTVAPRAMHQLIENFQQGGDLTQTPLPFESRYGGKQKQPHPEAVTAEVS